MNIKTSTGVAMFLALQLWVLKPVLFLCINQAGTLAQASLYTVQFLQFVL